MDWLTYSARSEFSTESGAITGDSLAIGGTWQGAGDAADFSAGSGLATRTAVSDAAGLENGRFATAGTTNYTTIVVQVTNKINTLVSSGPQGGVLARYTDTSNFASLTRRWGRTVLVTSSSTNTVGGSPTALFDTANDSVVIGADTWATLRLAILNDGYWYLQVLGESGNELSHHVGYDPVFAAGGRLLAAE